MTSSSVLARVNCPEKMLIVLDPSKEMGETYFDCEETNLKSNFNWIKIALKKFFMTKSVLNRKHQFALALLQPDGLFWYQEFTSDIKLIVDCLNDTEPVEEECENVKEVLMDPVFKDISKHMGSSVNDVDHTLIPKFIVRIILFYGRSHCPLMISDEGTEVLKNLYNTQRFMFDVLYLRNPADVDTEDCPMSSISKIDSRGAGYYIEVSESLAQLFEGTAKLLAHPLQRGLLQSVSYTLKIDDPPHAQAQVDSNGTS